MISSPDYDALVVGGGPAGSAFAIAAAQAGRRVILAEKSQRAHDKVCGEFISPESLPLFRRSGVALEELDAQTVHSVRLAAREVLAEVRLPAPALSLTRRILDEALLERARQAGVCVLRGCTVESLTHHAEGNDGGIWRAKALAAATQLPTIIDSRDAFLATGKHDLRGWPRPAKGSQHTLVAMKMYFLLSPRQWEELAGHVELIVYPGGYAGLQPVENGYTNFCALITREKLRMLDKRWDYLLGHIKQHCPHLARRLDGAASLLDRPLTLSAIPYGYCAETSFREPAPWRLGDQAAVIPSFCGDGMAIALYTAHRAAQLYLDGLSPAVFHEEVRRRLHRRLYFSTMLSRLIIEAPLLAKAARLWPSALSMIFAATRVPGIRAQNV